MSVTENIRDHLLKSADIVAMVDDRIHAQHLPQGRKSPAAVLYLITGTTNEGLTGPLHFDQAIFQIDAYGNDVDEADRLNKLIRDYLCPRDDVDPEAGRFQSNGMDFKEVTQQSYPVHDTDPVEAGGDQYRFITRQDFSFYHCSN